MGIGPGARRGPCGCNRCLGLSGRYPRANCASHQHAADDRSVSLAISPDGQKIVFVANGGRPCYGCGRSRHCSTAGWDQGAMARSGRRTAERGVLYVYRQPAQAHRDAITSRRWDSIGTGACNRDGTILSTLSDRGPSCASPPLAVKVWGDAAGGTGLTHQFPQFLPDGRHSLTHAKPQPTCRVYRSA